MKFKILYLFILIIGLYSCDTLDVEPLDKIEGDNAITTKKGVEGAITGAYDQLQSASLSQDAIVFGDLAADNLIHVGTKKEYRQISDNLIVSENGYVEGLWNSCYDGINRVNNILAQIDNVEGLSTEEVNDYIGQCEFMRAINYFTLVKFFGGVPLKTEPTTGISNDEINASRASESETYNFIINDLKDAESKLKTQKSEAYASVGAAKALLARAYLYTGQWQQAADKAKEVIDMGYSLVDGANYGDIYDETKGSNSEVIFLIDFYNDDDVNEMADWFLPESRYEVSAWRTSAKEESVADKFEDNDLRKSFVIGVVEGSSPDYYGTKYTLSSTDKDNIIFIRLAEMYLIRAEALNELGYTSNGEAFEMLNVTRERAGLSPLTSGNTTDQNAFRLAVENERRLELVFEGHRFFDLRRTGRGAEVLPNIGTLVSENQMYFPIPQSEMDLNSAMTQNPGY